MYSFVQLLLLNIVKVCLRSCVYYLSECVFMPSEPMEHSGADGGDVMWR